MILLSGDLHANCCDEARFITKKYLQNNIEDYDAIKYHIILGDGGWLWDSKTDKYLLKFLGKKQRGFPMLVVFGNHENYDRILQCPLVDIGIGNKVYEVYQDNVYYLQRGYIYEIEGKTILALGGGLSIDKMFRQEHISWWKEEFWSYSEEKALFELLKTHNKFDYVVSHTGPENVNNKISPELLLNQKKLMTVDRVAIMNEEIDKIIKYNTFFAGHFHINWYHINKYKRYAYLYKNGLEVI